MRVPIDGLPVFGPASALVTIVEFTDYQCPYCARAESRIQTLKQTYGDDVRIAIAAHPLPMHENARAAALAAFAAAEQGKMEEMHAHLFAHANALDDAGLAKAAADVGLDVARFEAARRGPNAAAALAQAEALAKTAGVKGTPTFFVNGRRVIGAQPIETFKTMIDEELARARALVASGTKRTDVYAKILESAAPLAPATEPGGEACGAGEGECGKGKEGEGPSEQKFDVRVDGLPLRGFARAPITIVVFGDFECPFSAREEGTLRELEQSYAGKVRVAFKNRPLPMHEHARLAAKAAIAAGAQGKFWEYHDVLFAHTHDLDRASLDKYAKDLGLDMARFARDIASADVEARIAADEAEAKALGVEGTPTTFVNGRRVIGAQPLTIFTAAVDRALTEAK